jgi:hypothetical protein
MLGRFLEVSLHAPDILESFHFYERLGFTSAPVGETWSHKYAVVTDGRIPLGLHEFEFASPALTYVKPELVSGLDSLERSGIEFAFRKLGEDRFNEAGFVDPNGLMITLLEARTYSPPARRAEEISALGWFEEFVIPVAALEPAQAFWERIGFVTTGEGSEPFPHLSLTSDHLNIGLYLTRELRAPTLVFSNDDVPGCVARLKDLGIAAEARLPRSLRAGEHALFLAPEGTALLVGPPRD